MIHKTFSDVRLGDNLAHLHFLRGLAKLHPGETFLHGAHSAYLPQMVEVVADLPNITLQDLRYFDRNGAVYAWKNKGRFWQDHELKNEYGPFMLEWFRHLADEMGGFASPFSKESELLFDYPAIRDTAGNGTEILIVNSEPMSGQCRSLDLGALDSVCIQLAERGHQIMTTRPVKPWIPCTQSYRLSTTAIGGLSRSCKYILMVSTGVSWATFNVWNTKSVKRRIIILEDERINIAPNCVNVNTVGLAVESLQDLKLL